MNATTIRVLVAAVVAVGAIAFVAAAIDAPVDAGGGPSLGGPDREPSAGSSDVQLPTLPWTILLLAALVVGVLYVLDRPREAIAAGVGAAVVLWAIAAVMGRFDTDGPDREPVRSNGTGFDGAPNGTFGADAGVELPTSELGPLLVAAVLGLSVVGIVAATLWRGDASDDDPATDERDSEAALGRVAGRAADRIESANADADNEVYRAWREMTGLLDVPNPEASTPGEFADAAVGAGMDPADVAELTALFEEVRYGAAGVTADREGRAVAALRSVEATYADSGEDE